MILYNLIVMLSKIIIQHKILQFWLRSIFDIKEEEKIKRIVNLCQYLTLAQIQTSVFVIQYLCANKKKNKKNRLRVVLWVTHKETANSFTKICKVSRNRVGEKHISLLYIKD